MARSKPGPSLKPAYVVQFVVLTLVSFGLYSIAPWLLALAINAPVSVSDLFQTVVPSVEQSVIWNGKLVVPQQTISMLQVFRPGRIYQSLELVDFQTRESRPLRTKMPTGPIKFVPDGPVLWCLIGSTIFRIENDQVVETNTGTTLAGYESAFIYEGRLAVIAEHRNVVDSTNSYRLLVFNGSGWQDQGQVLLPGIGPGEQSAVQADGTLVDEATRAMQAFQGPTGIRVLSVGGQTHVFCSDGVNVLYSDQLEVLPDDAASALAPQNQFVPLTGWLSAGSHTDLLVGVDAAGALIVDLNSGFRNVGVTTDGVLTRLSDGKWKEDRKWEHKGFLIQPHLISDGQKAWIVGQTFANKISVTEITEPGKEDVRLPLSAGSALEKLATSVQNHAWWVPLPILAAYAFAASALMAKYRVSQYEFGNGVVEFAPFGLRTLAKMVDWMLSTLPMLVAQRVFIGSQSDVQDWIANRVMEFNLADLKTVLLIGLGFVAYCLAWLIGLAVSEGVWGTSPGKWLFGLRVVRTTLRPCGFFRALAREVLLAVDALFCMGWLPGVLCIGLTNYRQRLGDIVGDTIVIRKPGTEQSVDALDNRKEINELEVV